jgi:CRISPR-associated endonuclease/helicase Cas3
VRDGQDKADDFESNFAALTGFHPLDWQRRLFHEHFKTGNLPSALDVPTGLGKTSVMAIWLFARALGKDVPRRIVYVVDRRAVVDQATTEAEKLRNALAGKAKRVAAELKKRHRLSDQWRLPISTLRGAYVDNREWLDDPSSPAIIIGTVDMIGSRLLFEGYGVSRKMRPYHAGLLGIDALVVLDESHLVPPFAHLLRAGEQDPSLRPDNEVNGVRPPRFVFLPLSATQREAADVPGRMPFRLEESDWRDDGIARKRLNARKRLQLEPLAAKDPDKQLAEAAWELAMKDGKAARVVVFCDRREIKDGGRGPSAQGVADAIKETAKGGKKTGRIDFDEPELLVGARRVRDRIKAAERLTELGFIGERTPPDKPTFLVATSAGEVGVDIDADHMVCDLVSWERMVQRLGRVNRRGEGDAQIRVFWSVPKDANEPTDAERRVLASKALIEELSKNGGAADVSPGALRRLAETARSDDALAKLTAEATTPEPLRPALNRPLLDAWSMTSLETHTGRPEVAPWLRGWVEETLQTTVVWRSYLPVRLDGRGRPTLLDKTAIADFFEAAPLHESEKLETETFRVVGWLEERTTEFLRRQGGPSSGSTGHDEEPLAASGGPEEAIEKVVLPTKKIERDDIFALILTSDGLYSGHLTLGMITEDRKGKAKEFQDRLVGKTLVVDVRFGGLEAGLLNDVSNGPLETADAGGEWSEKSGFRIRRCTEEPTREKRWPFEARFILSHDHEGGPQEWLEIEHFRTDAQEEDSRAISNPQRLDAHQRCARDKMLCIASGLDLPEEAANALAVGAALHDEGKKASRWQRAFNAPRDAKQFGLAGPLAKTRGPINHSDLDGYRHEFGSLRFLEESADFEALPEHWQEVVLHLVAAHHGRARPVIETRGCDDGPPSMLEDRARAVALRFARLQKRWGPWGLAWLESLLRAADRQASRDNDDERTTEPGRTTESA